MGLRVGWNSLGSEYFGRWTNNAGVVPPECKLSHITRSIC